jgi:3-hydroxyacyl-CoA dehydrogenase/enoyl-CoA hydratase/3-hydroxybutyryl-CoA epimerase
MNEAMRCVDEGIAPEAIDAALVAFGMPMGPIELADTVGLDVAVHAGKQLVGDAVPPKKLVELVRPATWARSPARVSTPGSMARRRKSALAVHGDPPLGAAPAEALLAATKRLVKDGVVADAELADAGVIFGTGFAPYTGGPMNYLETGKA